MAQETILRITIDSLSNDEAAVTAALSLSTVQLSSTEITEYLSALPTPPARPNVILRSLQKKGIVQVFATGSRKLHDALRLPAAPIVDRFSTEELLTLQIQLRNILFNSLVGAKDLPRLGAWMRLLQPTGRVETLVDLATTEYFHEMGDPSDLKAILVATAENEETDASIRFWALDALAFWEFQDGEALHLSAEYINRMEILLVEENLGDRERGALVMKQILAAALKNGRYAADTIFRKNNGLWKDDPELSRLARYNYATAVYHCGYTHDALLLAEALYAEYYDLLNLNPSDIIGANTEQTIALLPGKLADHQDDLKHLADCLSLAAMCMRKLRRFPRLTAIHAAKFYAASHSYKSAMKTAQDAADDFIAIGDAVGARQTMEEHVLPLMRYFNFTSHAMDVRGQYAVILAYCGDYSDARAEMVTLESYAGELSPEHQKGFKKQQQLIEEIAEGLVQLPSQEPPPMVQPKVRVRKQKIGRNAPCPCGSGNKYKKCCLGLRS